ncbi:MAG: type I restriction enzyme HsdR N-terminal domain-containing protein [Gammaproteobacteria bacterium]
MPPQPGNGLAKALLALVPEDGSAIAATKLRRLLAKHLNRVVSEAEYFFAQESLLNTDVLVKESGRGGSVMRARPNAEPAGTKESAAEYKASPPRQPNLIGVRRAGRAHRVNRGAIVVPRGRAKSGARRTRAVTFQTAAIPATVTEVLKGTAYALTIFTPKEITKLELFSKNGKPYLKCFATDKDRPAKPEEIVRQLYIRKLMDDYGYPKDRFRIEKEVYFGSTVHEKRADIVIIEKDTLDTPYIIVECKKARRKDGLEQLKSYCNAEGAPIAVWTNGGETNYLHREEPNLYRTLPEIPRANQTLAEMLAQPWTLADLDRENILVQERTSLKDVILNMEDLVLANAGVDAFEEVFKLIYAKLYDEARAARSSKGKRNLDFRVGGRTAREFSEVVNRLFDKACSEWPGVFAPSERINLEPDHLKVCGSALERVKLFNSNLSVIDQAFEYLSIKAAKGEKGQYFTPRHVIDMCVRMLNPTTEEYVIDTAAGSCGFTVHSIFHVWGDVFSAQGPNAWQASYAATHVYGIDFDSRSIKIAKALNTIAGDGKTNVYRANTLDPKMWPEETRAGLRPRLRYFRDADENRRNQAHFRYFDFDVLLTNPPFAGDIKDSRILSQYDLARKPKGNWQRKMGRDILFIERNLQFLRPGGRAAIVLPQGRFNNKEDSVLRDWIAKRVRILAVVGLHIDTFKPHTNTKTSVLFVQTWNDNEHAGPLNPLLDDYSVFLATSERPGKDSKGNYVYRIGPDNAPLLDAHHHMIVEHDLGEVADAFIAWGRKQGFGFCGGGE